MQVVIKQSDSTIEIMTEEEFQKMKDELDEFDGIHPYIFLGWLTNSRPVEADVSLQGAELKTKYRFIHFVEGLKDEWTVWTNKKDEYLGLITFHKKWKEWEFAPENYTGYTKQCLIDLVDFIKQLKAPQSN